MTDKTDMSKEREAFEAWIVTVLPSVDLTREGDGYYKSLADEWWDAFRAGRASVHIDLEDLATASAKGFRDGVASLAANAGSEPVALYHIACIEDGELRYMTGRKAPIYDCELYAMPGGKSAPPLYLHPSPPDGMVMAPVEPTEGMLDAVEEEVGGHCYSCSKWRASHDDCRRIWAAMIAAAPPTTSAGSGKGD